MESDVITLQDIFTFQQKEITADGKVVGRLTSTGLRPSFLDKFERYGVALARWAVHQPATCRSPWGPADDRPPHPAHERGAPPRAPWCAALRSRPGERRRVPVALPRGAAFPSGPRS